MPGLTFTEQDTIGLATLDAFLVDLEIDAPVELRVDSGPWILARVLAEWDDPPSPAARREVDYHVRVAADRAALWRKAMGQPPTGALEYRRRSSLTFGVFRSTGAVHRVIRGEAEDDPIGEDE